MDILGKAGQAVGDAVAKAKERERIRLEDRLRQIDGLTAAAQQLVVLRKHRLVNFGSKSEEQALKMISGAATIADPALRDSVDALVGIKVSHEGPVPSAQIDGAYRSLVDRLAEIRRDTLAED
jgi:hypothetical protein